MSGLKLNKDSIISVEKLKLKLFLEICGNYIVKNERVGMNVYKINRN
jgi:hypothetical protein